MIDGLRRLVYNNMDYSHTGTVSKKEFIKLLQAFYPIKSSKYFDVLVNIVQDVCSSNRASNDDDSEDDDRLPYEILFQVDFNSPDPNSHGNYKSVGAFIEAVSCYQLFPLTS